jgi:hypothetical protein
MEEQAINRRSQTMTKTHKLTVRGIPVKTRTERRYAVVAVRPEPVAHPAGGTLVAFAEVKKRTDSLETARVTVRRAERFRGGFFVVIDLETGAEV